jgi:hypothetical protein
MPSTDNLLEGASRILVGDANSDVLPADAVAFGASWGGNWRDLGYTTEDGVTLNLNQAVTPVNSAQSRTPIHYMRGSADDSVSCTLMEATLENIKLATGRGTISSGATYELLTLSEQSGVDFVAIGFEGVAPPNTSDFPRRVYLPRAMSNAQITYNLRFGAMVGIGVTFNRIGGSGNDMLIRDVTA